MPKTFDGDHYHSGLIADTSIFRLLDYLDLDDLFFVRKMNGMANGPKRAPIKAQYHVFAPLLSAIYQSKNAHAMHIMESIIAPNINQIPFY